MSRSDERTVTSSRPYPARMPSAEVTLPGEPRSVPTARRFVESILQAWAQPEHGWTAALLVSELAGNCALHARTPFTVRVALDGDRVRLEVSDGSQQSLTVRGYGPDSATGRGLRLVEELATGWGVDARPEGKTVWVDISPDGGPDGVRDDDPLVDDLDARPRRLSGPGAQWPDGPSARLAA